MKTCTVVVHVHILLIAPTITQVSCNSNYKVLCREESIFHPTQDTIYSPLRQKSCFVIFDIVSQYTTLGGVLPRKLKCWVHLSQIMHALNYSHQYNQIVQRKNTVISLSGQSCSFSISCWHRLTSKKNLFEYACKQNFNTSCT